MKAVLAALALCTACVGGRFEGRRDRPAVPATNGVEHGEWALEGPGRMRLFYQWWRPEYREVRAALLIVHGFRDHSTRYLELGDRLAQHGYVVYGFDLRGFGSSAGRRGYVESLDEYGEDLGDMIAEVRKRERDKPLFVLGQDLGGTIALRYAIAKKPELAGLIVSGVALQLPISGFRRAITKMAGVVLPLLAIFSVDLDHYSKDPKVVQACKDDPLIDSGNGPARTERELLNGMDDAMEHAAELKLPLLILHGGDDAVTSPEGSRELYRRATSADKTLHVYPAMYHDLWHEPERERPMQDLADWLDAHSPRA